MELMVADFQHEGKVCDDQDQLKMERRYCWAKGRDVLVEDRL